MRGRMERSLWHPLQIAIVLQALTSTVLCNKKKPDVVGGNPSSSFEPLLDAEKMTQAPAPSTGKCDTKMDLVFVIDATSHICNEGDKSILHSVPCPSLYSCFVLGQDVVRVLNIGQYDSQVSVVVFSTKATIKFRLNSLTDKASVLSAIDASDTQPDVAGGRNTAAAFDAVTNEVFVESAGDRPDVNNTVIAILHGNPTVDMRLVRKSLAALRKKVWRILAVGVGKQVKEEFIRDISSAPQKLGETYFLSDSHDQLKDIVGTLTQRICEPGPV